MKDNQCFGYTIYVNPSDVPGCYVMRGWDIEDGKTVFSLEAVATPISDVAIEVIRQNLTEMGLVCIGRQTNDDPVILETWI